MALNFKNALAYVLEDKRRAALGAIAFAFLTLGGAGEWFLAEGPSQATAGIVLRAGILLSVLWLAWPELRKLPLWLMLSIVGGIVAIWYLSGRSRWVLPFALGAIVMLAILRPRKRFGEKIGESR